MKTIQDIKKEKQDSVDKLITEVGMFFAFSNEQFVKNKTPLSEGDKYVSIGAGGYMAKSKVDDYLLGIKEINKQYKLALKENKLRKQNIAYELNNHEAFYTGEIDDTLQHLGEDYTREEVLEVYHTERRKQILKEEKTV